MNSICFICNRYPHVLTPTRHVFVQKLVWALADMGVECTVIAPVPVNQYLSSYKTQPYHAIEKSPKGNDIKLYFPQYITYGQKKIFGFGTSRLTTNAFHKVVRKVWVKEKVDVDVVYGHFLVPAGITAARIGREFKRPAFAAYGEATPRDLVVYGISRLKKEIDSLAGIVSVSTANKDVLLEKGLKTSEEIRVFPNGIQGDRFFVKDKLEARKKFGFKDSDFIISFVGQFNHRKGILRVEEAAKGLEGVKVAYAGMGKLEPTASNCIFKGPVNPKDMTDFLNASDLFVMPTLNEGCSNAIVEAISCGLPVVSSNLPFNADILGEDNAILVDPNNVGEIRKAILEIKNDPELASRLRIGTLKRAENLTIEGRAQNIKSWMESRIVKKGNLV
ncbi:MAG: glycosyltransferase family 4 protein [Pseudosphingobacterium sp.]|nr:glycosyltransferase family 4 protein [Olivibacter sp. UJ_SKK_5.1]MDX3912689.1 glycosyltransferase family 4 protein [Pseudosphingobacterium sp.]